MKTTNYRGALLIFLLTLLLSTPSLVQGQIDPSKIIDLPAGGSIDLPIDGGGIDMPGDGTLDGLSSESEYFDVIKDEEVTPSTPDLPDPGIPVDGGLSILLAAGLGYGANRIRKNRPEKREAE